ncbi:hypothetical protein JZU57_00180, partial [bacterium]|nr:hypothetical protein [bacterium]
AEEINRKLKSVFDETKEGVEATGLPKKFTAQETPTNDDGTIDPDGEPRWRIDVAFDAPYVDFNTTLKLGVRLHLPM